MVYRAIFPNFMVYRANFPNPNATGCNKKKQKKSLYVSQNNTKSRKQGLDTFLSPAKGGGIYF